ncbi:hypothetical protein Xdur_011150 [Xanthomonas citri pv. durantae]|uniref:Uncharacterized protein n=1 Tax=Xanthomonas citri pv. durantae TaxID=487862 RepID=A0A9X9II04_XANCI|nr:hypothetical protein [Xanthomonas citri]QRD56651.1 hypothetical protein H8Z75_03230 [Xanthomonas citri pv. citri]UVG60866.1 hypothetical protein Xdur_011150 [Xanthomonas citri pv. durantae]CEH50466.1 hypothetical protein XAC3615_14240009 [Xanthomonas citri pv. citri]CEH75162.1 hypothetical protein XAC3607_1530012 [Xanthomonas citri pv. citri]
MPANIAIRLTTHRRRTELQGDRQTHCRAVRRVTWGHRLVQCLHKTGSIASD